MKLQNLFESLTPTDVKNAADKNLVVEISEDRLIFIISDIPSITWSQWVQLLDVSFDKYEVSVHHIPWRIDVQKEPKMRRETGESGYGWYDELDVNYERGRVKINTMTWKELITYMKTNYPPGSDEEQDDFGE